MKKKKGPSKTFIILVTIISIIFWFIMLGIISENGERLRKERQKAEEKQKVLKALEELKDYYSR